MIVTTTQPDQQTWMLAFSDKFDFQSRHAFQSTMAKAEPTTPRQIILAFTGLSHIDSAGLALFTHPSETFHHGYPAHWSQGAEYRARYSSVN
jgi:anti-anti-sigma regulatory factor